MVRFLVILVCLVAILIGLLLVAPRLQGSGPSSSRTGSAQAIPIKPTWPGPNASPVVAPKLAHTRAPKSPLR